MNKNDIKKSIDSINPDPHLKTRLKAKTTTKTLHGNYKKLILTTSAICCVLVALGAGIALSVNEKTDSDHLAELSTNHASDSEFRQNADDYVPESTERVTLSPEELEKELDMSRKIQVHPENNQVAVSVPFSSEVNSDKKLIVNGKDISMGNYFEFYKIKNYVEIPFMPVLKEIADAEIIWSSDTTAKVIINGTRYNLDIDNRCVLTEEGKTENLFTPSPDIGDAPVYRFVDDQFILDDTTFSGIINALGYSVIIDYDAEVITIV